MKEKSNIIQPYVTYATIEQLNDEARTRANNDGLINNSLNTLSSDYQNYKTATNAVLNNKQNRNDNTLNTNNKAIVGAINELKVTSDSYNAAITQNSNDITDIKTNYVKNSDLGNELNNKQNITDSNLTTNEKNIVAAINELKTNNDTNASNISQNSSDISELKTANNNQETQINQNTTNIIANTTAISENANDINDIKTNYVKASDLGNELNNKQNITDDALTTTDHTITGAINELKVTSDSYNAAITQNSNDITDIKINYVKNSDLDNQLDEKQNINDESLTTVDNTVVGAINELNANKVTNEDFASFTESVIQYQNITNNNLNNKQEKIDAELETNEISVVGAINELKAVTDNNSSKINSNTTAISTIQTTYLTTTAANTLLAAKQNSTDNNLTTTSKNIVGAINELKTGTQTWTPVGTSTNSRTWTYNLIVNKKYRITYNWSASDATSKIYKEFVWTGNTISLETYIDRFNGVTILNITVLGSADVVELVATSSGVAINTKIGTSSIGRIISLEQAF